MFQLPEAEYCPPIASNLSDAITTLFVENRKPLYLTALAITRDHFLAEDALQEAYIKAIQKHPQLRQSNFLQTWIMRIVMNECKDLSRKNKRIVALAQTVRTDNLQQFNHEELRFFELIQDLTLTERRIVTLKFFFQFTLAEIADILQCPLSTVKSRLYRAINKLRTEMGAD